MNPLHAYQMYKETVPYIKKLCAVKGERENEEARERRKGYLDK